MNYIPLVIIVFVAIGLIIFASLKYFVDENSIAQKQLDEYLNKDLQPGEIGRLYERYIGHLYETEGYDVIYNGAEKGYDDLGRDLIVRSIDEVFIIQTKCWSQQKVIREKHVFQLFGTTAHYEMTSERRDRKVKAVLYANTGFSSVARNVARQLLVDLKTVKLDTSYPMIKCSINHNGEKFYYLPFDSQYDKVKIDLHRDEYFVKSVKEAVEKGFRRAG